MRSIRDTGDSLMAGSERHCQAHPFSKCVWPFRNGTKHCFCRNNNHLFLQEKKDILKHVLESHNALRAKHKAQPLKLNKDLSDLAQKHADHLAATKTFGHDADKSERTFRGGPVGENLAKSGTTGVLDARAEVTTTLERWYKEGETYNYDNPTYQVNTGEAGQRGGSGCGNAHQSAFRPGANRD